jgi:hypothetical protein
MKLEQLILNTTETTINKTVFIVRAMQGKNAKETAEDKLKRIICRSLKWTETPLATYENQR